MCLSDITECASGSILCYLNVHFGYERSDVGNLKLKITGLTFFVCKNGNGLLVYVVFIYTVLMFFTILCMQVNLKKKKNIDVQFILCEKNASHFLSVAPMNAVLSFSNRKHEGRRPSGFQILSSISF